MEMVTGCSPSLLMGLLLLVTWLLRLMLSSQSSLTLGIRRCPPHTSKPELICSSLLENCRSDSSNSGSRLNELLRDFASHSAATGTASFCLALDVFVMLSYIAVSLCFASSCCFSNFFFFFCYLRFWFFCLLFDSCSSIFN